MFNKSIWFKILVVFVLVILALALTFYLKSVVKSDNNNPVEVKTKEVGNTEFSRYGLKTDTAKTNIDLELVLSGGPGKDGIPAINNPKFISISVAKVADDVAGIFVEFDGVQKFYPYSILVWHEIVNDQVGDQEVAITFCPLCATGIVFDRNVAGEVLAFGVSGLLYESNLLMYDTKTESLWSQAKTEAVVGDFVGTRLTVLPMQLITFAELKEKYPKAMVLSEDTGHSRNYGGNPYGGYEETDDLYFPVSVSDKRFPAKEIMYVIPVVDSSFTLPYKSLESGKTKTFDVNGKKLTITRDGDEVVVVLDGQKVAGYYEMWFSWATHHQKDGIVLE